MSNFEYDVNDFRPNKRSYFLIFFVSLIIAFVVVGSIFFALYKKDDTSDESLLQDNMPYNLRGIYLFDGKMHKQPAEITLTLFAGYRDGKADYLSLFIVDNEKQTVVPLLIRRNTICDYYILDNMGKISDKQRDQIRYSFSDMNDDFISLANLKDAVSDLLCNARIDYYIGMNFDNLKQLSEVAGDVWITLESDCTYIDPSYKKGETILVNSDNVDQILSGDETKESSADIEQRENDYLAYVYGVCLSQKDQQKAQSIYETIISNCIANTNEYVNELNNIIEYHPITRLHIGGIYKGKNFIADKDSIEDICSEYIFKD